MNNVDLVRVYANAENELRKRRRQKEQKLRRLSLDSLRKKAETDDLAEKILCERSFVDFFRLAWPHFDPAQYMHNWHIDAICEHLQACIEGKINRLIINIPPGFGKTAIVSVTFPAWVWAIDPTKKFLTASHSAKLAERDSRGFRNLIMSSFYQKHWGRKVKLITNQIQTIENSELGYKSIATVGGNTTGKRGNIQIIDDPSDATQILSSVKRMMPIEWYRSTMATRVNDPKTAIRILVMQRLDELDLTGYLLNSGLWEHLCIKMEYEGGDKPTSIGWTDPRKQIGELLWPEKEGPEEIEIHKSELGSYGYAGQMQQSPVPRDGGYIKIEDIRFYKELPKVKGYSWSWDTALKTGQNNDYTVGMLWAECDDGYYLVDCFRDKISYPALKSTLITLYDRQKSSEVLIEEKSSGDPLVQELKRSTPIPIIGIIPGGKKSGVPASKEEKVIMVMPLFEAGKVHLPEGEPWARDVIEEWTRFPKAPHDDTVDAMSQYLCRKISNRGKRARVAVIY